MKTLTVNYFAVLREAAGTRSESVETTSDTAEALYAELSEKHGFPLGFDRIRVANGTEYVSGPVTLEDGMELTFLPPVAGG